MDLICSDLHSNIHALRRLRRYIDLVRPEYIFILGDIVGYGAFPNEAVEWVDDLQADYTVFVIHGNHDYAVRDPYYIRNFNIRAAQAAQWMIDKLTDQNKKWLNELPPELTVDGIRYVHGSPTNFDDYILNHWDVMNAFTECTENLCFFGHTHVPRHERSIGRVRAAAR